MQVCCAEVTKGPWPVTCTYHRTVSIFPVCRLAISRYGVSAWYVFFQAAGLLLELPLRILHPVTGAGRLQLLTALLVMVASPWTVLPAVSSAHAHEKEASPASRGVERELPLTHT